MNFLILNGCSSLNNKATEVSRIPAQSSNERPTKIWNEASPSFWDEFDGPGGKDKDFEDASCYSAPLYCMKAYNGHHLCQDSLQEDSRFADLNRCNWAIGNHPLAAIQDKTHIFATPNNVEVSRNKLVIKTNKTGSKSQENCGKIARPPGEPERENDQYIWGYTNECPYEGGLLWSLGRSKDYPTLKGFQHKFGRFEVKAKLQNHSFNFPAFWLMPENGDWPQDGEIDIMEQFNPDEVGGTLHDQSDKNRHEWFGHYLKSKDHPKSGGRNDFYYTGFHIYAVEWFPNELRFFVDDKLVGITSNGSRGNNRGRLNVPYKHPFYWILNTSIRANSEVLEDGYDSYQSGGDLEIEYVKTYGACDTQEMFCPEGGVYVNTPGYEKCVLLQLSKPNKVDYSIQGKRVIYSAQGGQCLHGGEISENDKCILLDHQGRSNIFRENKNIYYLPACADYRNTFAEYLRNISDESFSSPTLDKPYPNPARVTVSGITFRFSVPKPMLVRFKIVAMTGQVVGYEPANDWIQVNKGSHEKKWDGKINLGGNPASAPYIIVMEFSEDGGSTVEAVYPGQKLIIIK